MSDVDFSMTPLFMVRKIFKINVDKYDILQDLK